jgi:hypothetical protein
MRKKTIVSPASLFGLLDQEFRQLASRGCDRCRMPLPYRVSRPDASSANWNIGTPIVCAKRCHAAIAEVAIRLMAKYDLEEPAPERADDRGRRLH